MELAPLLGPLPEVVAVVGSGGKTTLLRRLSEELAGTVLLCTSTHIFPFPGLPCVQTRAALADAFRRGRVVCGGVPEPGTGKLTALPFPLPGAADHVLCEADGSRRLPLKAHDPGEPAIPAGTGKIILVAGLSGLGRPIREAAHRPARFAALCGADPAEPVTEAMLAAVLRREHLADLIFLNQAEGRGEAAKRLAGLLETPCIAGSLERSQYTCLF